MDTRVVIASIIGIFILMTFGAALISPIETSRASMVDANCAKTNVNASYNGSYTVAPCLLQSDGDCVWSQNQSRNTATCTNSIQQSATDKALSHSTIMGIICIALIITAVSLVLHWRAKGEH